MNHKAIYNLYPNVVSISESMGAFDSDGNKVEIDLDAVNAWVDNEEYIKNRINSYPSFAEQFDTLYHGGYDAWKATIDAVKNQYPKPE
jgi:hypothetical protein